MSQRLNNATEPISISLPGWLLDLLDEICERKDFSRSVFVKRAIKKYLLYQNDDLEIWKHLYADRIKKS